MIGAPWHWTILSFAASFFFSWLLFAVVWFIVAFSHGETEEGAHFNFLEPIQCRLYRLISNIESCNVVLKRIINTNL